jgi:hypothetical protein
MLSRRGYEACWIFEEDVDGYWIPETLKAEQMHAWWLGKMERWKDGKMERWKDGKMERWKDGKMER